jgi:voltage-gated potassium channel
MRAWLFRLLLPFIILQIVVVAGIIGYMAIEDYTFVQACYMTTLAITTVGFGEVRPLSTDGQIFTTILLIFSWSTFAFVIGSITQFVVNGEIRKFFKHNKIRRKIKTMNQHVIICGFGRNGQQAARTLKGHNIPFVVIEPNEAVIEKFVRDNFELSFIVGNATEDEILQRANVSQARALITTLPNDAENVFIVLSARALNSTVQIISRATDNGNVTKMYKAGASSVIMPDKIGGTHMATLVSKPDVVEFIDYLSGEEGESIHLETVDCAELPMAMQNKTLAEVMQWRPSGVISIGIKNAEGKFEINPPSSTVISSGTRLIVLGNRQQIDAMKHNLAG